MYPHVTASMQIDEVLTAVGCTVLDVTEHMGTRVLLVGFDGANLLLRIDEKDIQIEWKGTVYHVRDSVEAVEKVSQFRRAMVNAGFSTV